MRSWQTHDNYNSERNLKFNGLSSSSPASQNCSLGIGLNFKKEGIIWKRKEWLW